MLDLQADDVKAIMHALNQSQQRVAAGESVSVSTVLQSHGLSVDARRLEEILSGLRARGLVERTGDGLVRVTTNGALF